MRHFTKKHGLGIQRKAQAHVELARPVYLLPQDSNFTVQTRHGIATGMAGDAVSWNPSTGDIGLVSRGDLEAYAPCQVTKTGHVMRDGASGAGQAASGEDPDVADMPAARDEAAELLEGDAEMTGSLADT